MKKNNVWVLFFATALLVFLILSIHEMNKVTLDDAVYNNYTPILNTLDDKISYMYYGNSEENIKEYLELNNLIIETEDKIKFDYDNLFERFLDRELNFGQYFKVKNIYSSNLKRIDYIKQELESRVN